MKLYIDYGGTNFRYQINDLAIQTQKSQETDLIAFLEKSIPLYGIKKIGISFAGQVNEGKIISAPNICLKDVNIKKHIETKYAVQLEIQNDLKCAALFESSLHKEAKSLVVVYIGTGVGSGYLVNQELVVGKNNFAGELGHIPFKKTPFVCGCSRDDCLELSLGGNALALWSKHYNLNTAEISLEALKQDPLGKTICDEFENALEHLFLTLLTLYDPEVFVFGGGVMKNNPHLIESLKKFYDKSAFKEVRSAPKILLSSSMNGSLLGARILIKNKGIIYD